MPQNGKRNKVIYRDGFRINAPISLGFIDRLRVLITGRFVFQTEIVCENEAGRTKTSSAIIIEKVIPAHVRNSFNFKSKGELPENGQRNTRIDDEFSAR